MKVILESLPCKAPGPDGLGFKFIQEAYHCIHEHFNSYSHTTITGEYHPQIWRVATIAIIPKPNKPDYTMPKAYRPVSLLHCLGKVSETIITTRLAYLSKQHHLLHSWQIGGRPQRSSVDACMLVAGTVDNAKHKGQTVSSLCMDVKEAIDNVHLERLLKPLIANEQLDCDVGTHLP